MSVAVVGAGAVGSYFGGVLAHAGIDVTLIGRASHMDAIAARGLHIDSVNGAIDVAVRTATDLDAASGADILLFCVKAGDTQATAESLAARCGPRTLIVSMQNGVDNAERIRAATGAVTIPAVVYVAAEISAPGVIRHSGRGDVVIGADDETITHTQLQRAAGLFASGRIPCRISDGIVAELWTKLAINCAYNAISALARARYGTIAEDPAAMDLMRRIVHEVVDVAHAASIPLDREGLIAGTLGLAASMPQAQSSTAQDLERGRPTEIAALNGHVAAVGHKLGIPTPFNTTLFTLVTLLEKSAR